MTTCNKQLQLALESQQWHIKMYNVETGDPAISSMCYVSLNNSTLISVAMKNRQKAKGIFT